MRSLILVLGLVIVFISCKKENNAEEFKSRDISKVEIETVLKDSSLNVRAIEFSDNLFYATSNGKIASIVKNNNPEHKEINNLLYRKEAIFLKDSLFLNFRSLALNKNYIFALGIGSPAVLVRMLNDDSYKVVYKEEGEGVFYDSMEFWNDQEGIAIGDSIDGCLSVIITRDGGNTWNKLTCDQLPLATEGEGAFAASDTNIAIVGNKTWVATTAGRVYYSVDKGKTWEVTDTPILKDKETEGIYSIDFYDELNGFGIGGDYTKSADSSANKIRTQDGGKTWHLVAQNQSPGYRSCVQYIPNREGKELVTIGFKGIDYSNDSGNTWKHLSDEGFYTIRFLNDSVAYAAGAGRISKLTFRE